MGRNETEALITRFLPLAFSRGNRAARQFPGWRDEIVSDALLWLVKGVRTWRPERGPFPVHAAVCVWQGVEHAITRINRRGRLQLSAAFNNNLAHSPLPYIASRNLADRDVDAADSVEMIFAASALDPIDRRIVAGYVLNGDLLVEIARDVGLHPHSVTRRLHRSLGTLRALPLARELAGIE